MLHRKRLLRWSYRAFLIVMAALGFLVFAPLSFEVKDRFRLPHTFRGFPVVRYGISRVDSISHADSLDGTGATIHGARCFIDILEKGRVRRESGWRLVGHLSADRSVVRLDLR